MRPATPAELRTRLAGVNARVVVCGHSNQARLVELDATTLVVNPGSVGLPAYADDAPEPHIVETGAPHARYALLERGTAGWGVELVGVAYDLHAAVQARR